MTEQETTVDDEGSGIADADRGCGRDVGKQVYPVVLPTNNPLYAIATAARDLKATEVVLGVSAELHAEMQLEQFALAWGSATADAAYWRLREI